MLPYSGAWKLQKEEIYLGDLKIFPSLKVTGKNAKIFQFATV